MWRPPPTIGIDIGGTHIRSVRWNGTRIVKHRVAKTPDSFATFRALIRQIVQSLTPFFGSPPPIGIGCPGVISGNVIIRAANIEYLKSCDFDTVVPAGRTYVLEHDARAFLWAEYCHGAGTSTRRIMGFTLGTGVGRAFGESGNVIRVREFEDPEPWESAYQKIYNRDELAPFLAQHLAPLVKRHNPDLVIFGGGVFDKKDGSFLATLTAMLAQHRVRTAIRKSQFGVHAGAIGAAALAALRFAPPHNHR